MFEHLNVEAFARMIITNNSRFENSENRMVFFVVFRLLYLKCILLNHLKIHGMRGNFSIYAIASYPLLCFWAWSFLPEWKYK